MRKNTTTSVITGVALGAVLGTATYMLSSNKVTNRMLKKNASKAMKSVGSFVDEMMYNIKR